MRSIVPTLDLLESGLPIADGALYTRAVTPEIRCSDPEATITATLDGAPYLSGTAVDAAGSHTLAATAVDPLERSVTRTVTFRIDLSAAPTIAITEPSGRRHPDQRPRHRHRHRDRQQRA